jgi:enoyl-CoA hydratase/carnithine racemase
VALVSIVPQADRRPSLGVPLFRPEKHNAMDHAMIMSIERFLQAAQEEAKKNYRHSSLPPN